LSKKAIDLISDPANDIFVSAAVIWEIRIKESIKKIEIPSNFREELDKEPFHYMPILIDHVDGIKN